MKSEVKSPQVDLEGVETYETIAWGLLLRAWNESKKSNVPIEKRRMVCGAIMKMARHYLDLCELSESEIFVPALSRWGELIRAGLGTGDHNSRLDEIPGFSDDFEDEGVFRGYLPNDKAGEKVWAVTKLNEFLQNNECDIITREGLVTWPCLKIEVKGEDEKESSDPWHNIERESLRQAIEKVIGEEFEACKIEECPLCFDYNRW